MAGAWSPSTPATFNAGEIVLATKMNAEVRDRMLWLGGTDGKVTQIATATSTTSETTTSNSGVQMTAPQVSLTTGGGDIVVLVQASLTNTTVAVLNNMFLFVDGASVANIAGWNQPVATYLVPVFAHYKLPSPLSSASHTFGIGWACSSGTLATTVQTIREITVVELRR